MESVESYKHLAAKRVVINWLRSAAADVGYDHAATFCNLHWKVNRPGPGFGIWDEYPVIGFMVDAGRVWAWDEDQYVTPPSFQELVDIGTPPKVIFDVAVQQRGEILYAFEIVHAAAPTAAKIDILTQLSCTTFALEAEWIMRQVGPPTRLRTIGSWGADVDAARRLEVA